MTTWPTHRARARHSRQLQRWARRKRKLERRATTRTKQSAPLEVRP